jgi:ribose transport system permease protein
MTSGWGLPYQLLRSRHSRAAEGNRLSLDEIPADGTESNGETSSSTQDSSPLGPAPGGHRGGFARMVSRFGPWAVPAVLILVAVIFQVINSRFLSTEDLESMSLQASLPAIAAIGLTMVLSVNQFDVSIEAVAGLGTVLVAALIVNHGLPVMLAVVLTVLVGAVIGVVNGFLVGYVGLAAFIVTIGASSIAEGFQFTVGGSSSTTIALSPTGGLVALARGRVGPVPNMAILALVVAVIMWLVLDRTPFGRHMRAVGSNPVAARYAGINVKLVTLVAFVLSASMAALAGAFYAGSQAIVQPLSGLSVLLPSFAACFIGSAMFRVGEFNIPGTVVGVVLLQEIATGLVLANVGSYVTYFFQGGTLIAAILFGRLVAGYRAS